MRELTDVEADELHTLLHDEIVEFGFTQDVTPTDWLALEIEAVRKVRAKVLDFERGLDA